MDWIEKLEKAGEDRDEDEARRLYDELPELPTLGSGATFAIIIPNRRRATEDNRDPDPGPGGTPEGPDSD